MAAGLGAEKGTTDIVKRLEADGIGPQPKPQMFAGCKEAAEEIRRLRTKVKVLTDELEDEIKSNYG